MLRIVLMRSQNNKIYASDWMLYNLLDYRHLGRYHQVLLGTNEELTGLDAAHKRFHREVDVVLASLHHGSLRRADEAYEDALTLSGEIVTHLTRLQLTFIDSHVLSARSSKL